MNYRKKLYGKTIIDSSNSEELEGDHKIELEYYKTKNDKMILEEEKPYGIEVIKELANKKVDIEKKVMNNICRHEQDTNRILELLITNKVTPMSVEDIITDLRTV